ncbi:MAG: chemotaxis protein CheA [Polyangiaceae bacterium]
MDLDRQAIMQTFLGEAEECLVTIEQKLLALDGARTRQDADAALGEIFRATHTLKGNAESMGFEAVGRAAHALEGVLDAIRKQTLAVSPSVTSVLLSGHDALRSLIAAISAGQEPSLEPHDDAIQALADAADGHVDVQSSEPMMVVGAAAAPQETPVRRSLRVDLATLDQAVTHTGELAIALSRLRTTLGPRSDALDALHEVERLFGNLRELMMRTRLLPIGPMLRQQLRAVRDLATSHGKMARLVVEGDDVEVDAAVRDGLRDPITHMVRNAIDHALELPDARATAGKEPFGTITLRARREAGWVLVEVCDDGAGFRRDRILSRAREIGLVREGVTPPDDELLRLVLTPGFSTASTVTDLSGRGVGMDVVARNVAALKGTIAIRSTEGKGSTVTIRVPLTLAIIDGFAVEAASETYVIPMDAVRECVGLRSTTAVDDAGARGGIVNLRGEALPYVRLGSVLGAPASSRRAENVVVVEHDGMRAGLLVEILHGETQAVIRPLGGGLTVTDPVAGATILGNGRVALILDIPAVLKAAVAGAAA